MGGGVRRSSPYWQCIYTLGLLRRFPVPDWSVYDYRVARLLLQGGMAQSKSPPSCDRAAQAFRGGTMLGLLRRTVQAAAASLTCRPAFSRAPMVLERG